MTFKLHLAAAAAAVLAMAASPALAGPKNLSEVTLGYTYFNHPGADMAAHDAAVIGCALEAAETKSMDAMVQPAGILGLMIGDAFAAVSNKATAASGLENCMVVRGWRVVRLPEAEGKALSTLDQPALAAKLSPWIGQETPNGEIVRVWANDAADAALDRFAVRPGKTRDGQLSLKAANKTAPFGNPPLRAAKPKPVKLDPKWPTRPMKPEDMDKLPAGSGVIMVDVRGVSLRNGIGVIFTRMGPDRVTMPSTLDQGPDVLRVLIGTLAAKKDGNLIAVAVPPGRWRLAGMGLLPTVNFCLGSPAFEVKPGDVVFAGSFDMSASDLGPNLDLAQPRAWLAGRAAEKTLRPASYVNGTMGACADSALYAYEVKGAPFEPGYVGGSVAWGKKP